MSCIRVFRFHDISVFLLFQAVDAALTLYRLEGRIFCFWFVDFFVVASAGLKACPAEESVRVHGGLT